MIRDYLLLLSWLCTVHGGEVGFFWQISDLHYDPRYSLQANDNSCWKMRNNMDSEHTRLYKKLAGTFGSYGCDSPWALIDSAVHAMREHGKGIEFVLWTGDALSHAAGMNGELRLQCLKNLTDLLSHTFREQFVFPVLGHEDLGLNFTLLANLWSHWLPSEALASFKNTGFYTIELRTKNYRIIFLNTNLWLNVGSVIDNRVPQRSTNTATDDSKEKDPLGQWAWFESVLKTARSKMETVYIVGHTPPGVDEREHGAGGLKEKHNTKYLLIVRQYADIIRGQFFGHWHSDTFRVVYSDAGSPVSWMMMAPSITPYRPGGPNNPGLRLYKFDKTSGQVLDYIQYYLDLPEANSLRRANWVIEYSFLKHYELKEITALSLHDLADRLTQPNDNAFVRYYAANTVSLPREVEEIWGCGGALNGACALQHYCSVTRLDPVSYSNCFQSDASALASTSSPSVQIDLVILYQLLAILLTILQCR